MFEDNADVFLDLMDDSGNLPGDDAFVPGEATGDDGLNDATDLLADEIDDQEEDEDDAGTEDEDDEGEPDGADEESDEEDTDEDSSDDEDESGDQDKLYDIEIDGETYEVNLPELQAGYLRNEEFVKRATQADAEHAQRMAAVEVKEAELLREIESYAVQGIAELRQYDNIDWNRLRAEDPEGYQAKRLEFLDKRELVQAQINKRGQIQALQNKAAELKHEAYLNSQRKLITELLPDFEKPEFQSGLIKFADSIGISEDEVRGIADAKHLQILDMARKYAEGQVKRKEVLQKKATTELPKVLKGSAKRPPVNVAQKGHKAAMSRLREEQSLDAAAAVFLQFA